MAMSRSKGAIPVIKNRLSKSQVAVQISISQELILLIKKMNTSSHMAKKPITHNSNPTQHKLFGLR